MPVVDPMRELDQVVSKIDDGDDPAGAIDGFASTDHPFVVRQCGTGRAEVEHHDMSSTVAEGSLQTFGEPIVVVDTEAVGVGIADDTPRLIRGIACRHVVRAIANRVVMEMKPAGGVVRERQDPLRSGNPKAEPCAGARPKRGLASRQ